MCLQRLSGSRALPLSCTLSTGCDSRPWHGCASGSFPWSAVIATLADLGSTGLSAETGAAAEAFRCVADDLAAALAGRASGLELIERGFGADVAIAAELDASRRAPGLSGERFVNAG
jgi:hypothetical protein